MVLRWQGIYFSTLSHIAYESQLIVLLLHFGEKKLAKESSSCMIFVWYSWYLFDTPPKNIWQTSFHFDFFSLFSGGIQSIPKKKRSTRFPGRRFSRLLRSRPLMHPETPFAANGLGRLGGGKTMLASGIDLFSFKLPPKTSHPMVYPSSQLHTSDVGVHVLPHLPSREALRCPPWHLRCFVHKEKLVTKRAET